MYIYIYIYIYMNRENERLASRSSNVLPSESIYGRISLLLVVVVVVVVVVFLLLASRSSNVLPSAVFGQDTLITSAFIYMLEFSIICMYWFTYSCYLFTFFFHFFFYIIYGFFFLYLNTIVSVIRYFSLITSARDAEAGHPGVCEQQ